MKTQFSPETQELIKQLPSFIEQIGALEESFNEQRALLKEIIEVQPTALWVLNSDNTIYVSNEKARSAPIDPCLITIEQNDTEIEIDEHNFLLQVSRQNNKTIIVAIDNTKSRRNERLIAMGQMAAHLAHEIRNPIGAVAILASELFERVELRYKPIVLEMKKSIWRVERIVKATLLFSKGFTLNPRKFSLNDFAQELFAAVENYSYSKTIDFEFNLPNTVIEADFDLMLLVLQNMVFNAIDAIETSEVLNGHIAINYRKNFAENYLEITDNGKDFEDKKRIFEAFHTTKTKGHGLGLVLSRQIVEAHKGVIAILDDKKGFSISFK